MVDNSIFPDVTDATTTGHFTAVRLGLEPIEPGPAFVAVDPDGLCAAKEG